MQENIRLKLDVGGRAVAFCRAHPDADPATAPVVERLGITLARADSLILQQRSGVTIVAAAVIQKAGLRASIENELAALFGVARAAAVAHPDIAVHRRLPRPRTNEKGLLTMARVTLAEATLMKELLLPFGLSDDLLQRLAADIEAYEAETARQRNALAAQVGATSDLKAVTVEMMRVIRNLDAIHKIRFVTDPEMQAAWKSARNVAWRRTEPEVPETPSTPASPPDQVNRNAA